MALDPEFLQEAKDFLYLIPPIMIASGAIGYTIGGLIRKIAKKEDKYALVYPNPKILNKEAAPMLIMGNNSSPSNCDSIVESLKDYYKREDTPHENFHDLVFNQKNQLVIYEKDGSLYTKANIDSTITLEKFTNAEFLKILTHESGKEIHENTKLLRFLEKDKIMGITVTDKDGNQITGMKFETYKV